MIGAAVSAPQFRKQNSVPSPIRVHLSSRASTLAQLPGSSFFPLFCPIAHPSLPSGYLPAIYEYAQYLPKFEILLHFILATIPFLCFPSEGNSKELSHTHTPFTSSAPTHSLTCPLSCHGRGGLYLPKSSEPFTILPVSSQQNCICVAAPSASFLDFQEAAFLFSLLPQWLLLTKLFSWTSLLCHLLKNRAPQSPGQNILSLCIPSRRCCHLIPWRLMPPYISDSNICFWLNLSPEV